MIAIQVEDNSVFLDYTKNHIRKNFSTSLFLKHSIMIFSREQEQIKRKIFLNWICQLYDKHQKTDNSKLQTLLWQNINLPITVQIVAKNAVVDASKVFASFEGEDGVKLRIFGGRSLLVSYLGASLRQKNVNVEECGHDIWLQPFDTKAVLEIKKLLDSKVNLAGKPYVFIYEKRSFEEYLRSMQRGFLTDTIADEKRELLLSLQILKCTENDNFETIRKNYIKLIKTYHPDRVFGQNPQLVESYQNMFRKVQSAYECLRERVG